MPNQQGIDTFDFVDAFGAQKEHICSPDLIEFIEKNHLDLTMEPCALAETTDFDVRAAFGMPIRIRIIPITRRARGTCCAI